MTKDIKQQLLEEAIDDLEHYGKEILALSRSVSIHLEGKIAEVLNDITNLKQDNHE